MKKRILYTIAGLILVTGVLGGIKALQIHEMILHGEQSVPPPLPVNTVVVQKQSWQELLSSVGSLEAVEGVMVTAELTGKVVKIGFEPGTMVRAGDLLVQQDISSEKAQLRGAEAALELARVNVERMRKLLADETIAQSQYDNAAAQYKEARAQVDNIRATIEKKTIRAPFAGRLGIRLVNLGQTLNEGDQIVSLQSLNPIFVNFSLPQQELAQIRLGLKVQLTTDVLPGEIVEGKITAINSQVDTSTRNIGVQATVANSQEHLRPGMFVKVDVVLPVEDQVLAIPTTAVLYAPYGDSVFVVEEEKSEKNGQHGKIVRQQFVRLGEKRGDFASVVSGLKEGETVVSTGAFKLRNGQAVVVDNTLAPGFQLAPKPEES
ncbi:MAG: efflux RND transporter periplasmic adaptor subunit [Deltaproteobacteria bacterium]|nr:efflux RND transporter periplasmic adaptor subunit [Deltaproteobacteria bacterium]